MLADENNFFNPHTKGDLNNLKNQLKQILSPHLNEKEHLSLLNLACGRADETKILSELLHTKSQQNTILGLDIRAAEIDTAIKRWQNNLPDTDTHFLTHRADQLENLQLIDKPDLVFLRHQNFWNDQPTWSKIFDQALQRLDEDGHLIITSYFDQEHRLATQALEQLGAIKIDSIQNQKSRLLHDAPGKSIDRHIAIFQKSQSRP